MHYRVLLYYSYNINFRMSVLIRVWYLIMINAIIYSCSLDCKEAFVRNLSVTVDITRINLTHSATKTVSVKDFKFVYIIQSLTCYTMSALCEPE